MLGRFRNIVVEGPIGAGKTSLARKLAARMGASLVLENADENPFLSRFYEDRKRYALHHLLEVRRDRRDRIHLLDQVLR